MEEEIAEAYFEGVAEIATKLIKKDFPLVDSDIKPYMVKYICQADKLFWNEAKNDIHANP